MVVKEQLWFSTTRWVRSQLAGHPFDKQAKEPVSRPASRQPSLATQPTNRLAILPFDQRAPSLAGKQPGDSQAYRRCELSLAEHAGPQATPPVRLLGTGAAAKTSPWCHQCQRSGRQWRGDVRHPITWSEPKRSPGVRFEIRSHDKSSSDDHVAGRPPYLWGAEPAPCRALARLLLELTQHTAL